MNPDDDAPNIGESSYVLNSIAQAWGGNATIYGLLKYEIDKHIYYYGNHFRNPYENNRSVADIAAEIQYRVEQISIDLNAVAGLRDWQTHVHNNQPETSTIVCNAYHSWSDRLSKVGWNVEVPLWVPAGSSNDIEVLLRRVCEHLVLLCRLDFQFILSKVFFNVLEGALNILRAYYNHPKYRAVLVPYTLPFFEGAISKVFQELQKPTFLAMHGLLNNAGFWNYREHQVDFYVVWGDYIAEDLITFGNLPRDKVLVSGHPDNPGTAPKTLRYDFDNVLVLGKCSNGAPSYRLGIYQNRAEQVDYPYRVQNILKRLGVTRARLRPHPSESYEWYERTVDPHFYSIDREDLTTSLQSTSLVIGPVSTVFVESILKGVNFCIFEPAQDYNPCHYEHYYPTRPWDGSDPRIPVAKNDSELESLLRSRKQPELSFITDYIKQEFNPHCIGEAIERFEARRSRG